MATAAAEDWIDPLHRGLTSESDTEVLAGTTPAGHDLVVDTMSPLHAWGIIGGAAVTVEANVLPETLVPAVDQVLSG